MKKQKVDMVKQMKEEAKQRQEKEKEVLKSTTLEYYINYIIYNYIKYNSYCKFTLIFSG